MGVYIKDMEMPNNCHECELVDILPTCPCKKMADEDFWNNVSLAVEGHKDCPLKNVPTPHGRLIDADALKAWFVEWYDLNADLEIKHFLEILSEEDSAPTVIEAEEDRHVY